jgi:hypothetical protein
MNIPRIKVMIPTPEEKKRLSDLLQNMQISGSYDYALYANQYHTLVNQIRTRDPHSILTADESREYDTRVRELTNAQVSPETAGEVALKEILGKRRP